MCLVLVIYTVQTDFVANVSKFSDEMKKEIKHAEKDVPILIVADEMCVKNGRCLFYFRQ